MNPTMNTYDTTMPNVHVGCTELLDSEETMNSGMTTSSFSMLMSQEMLAPFKQIGELEPMSNHFNFEQYSIPIDEAAQPQFLYSGLGEEKLPSVNKRKASNASLPNMLSSNKRTALSGSSPWNPGVPQLATQSNKSEVPSKSPKTSVSSKKMVQIEPDASKSQSVVSRNRVTESESSSKIEAEKLDPVRTKLKESLTAALALVSQVKTSSLDADKTDKNSDLCPTNHNSDAKIGSPEVQSKEVSGEPWKFLDQDFQSNPIFPSGESPFGESLFLRDELLQGNGLSWAMDFDAQIAEMQAVESTRRDELAHEADAQEKEQVDMSPESVAFRIESELFTLFGGVNKKYKEKARSLLFNLKDRNNPELRERVMSGEIQPERLCSMTAEELASKELSQWRMAKAEELDQMKVLPDSEVNVRRLVKKTHKGEYQVEFDQDVSVVEDLPANISVVHENRKRKTSDGAKEHGDGQCAITIPGDGADMLGLMVDDMKDLPPILSLDEFMDSLDKEPPFENLPINSGRKPELDKIIVEDDGESKSPATPSTPLPPSPTPVPNSKKVEEVDKKNVLPENHVNNAGNQRASAATIMAEQVKVEYLWEGLLQLTLSSTAYVVASYKSGEKASTREWPSSFEIKGRVRLDAFDKFLQELPKSRTRATMVVHFALAKRCTEEERCNLIDLVDSYVTDQRLGYAEPTPGVELYICPPRSKTVDMIINHLPKGYTEMLSDIDDGLIGILVWRKERVPSVTLPLTLPNPSSQLNPLQKEVNRGGNLASRVVLPVTVSKPISKPAQKSNDDDGDAPPGFGPPGGAREDDDLPEFNFSAGPNLSMYPTTKLQIPPRGSLNTEATSKVEQMRALIQKYGKSGDDTISGIPIQPWNDDDDDDIPEWQPHTAHYQKPYLPPGFPTQKPTLMSHGSGRPSIQQPIVPVASQMPLVQPDTTTPGTWQHPVPNAAGPTGNRGIRGRSTGTRFRDPPVSGHRNRDRRTSGGYRR